MRSGCGVRFGSVRNHERGRGRPSLVNAGFAMRAAARKLLAAARMAKPAFTKDGRPLPRSWFLTDPKRTPHPERIVANLPPGFGVIYRHYSAKDRFAVGAALAL